METKIRDAKSILANSGFYLTLEIPTMHLSGGIISTWRLGVDLEQLRTDRHPINLLIHSDLEHQPWRLTLIHCPTNWQWNEAFGIY